MDLALIIVSITYGLCVMTSPNLREGLIYHVYSTTSDGEVTRERRLMTTHSETKFLPYTAQQMYDLVSDVASYPKFLPWTAATRIRSTTDQGDHVEMRADLVISFKVFREMFGSRVLLWPADKKIDTAYLDGPFKHMQSQWQFVDVDGGCDVSFNVDFEFKNRLLQGAAGLFFYEAMQRVVRSFEARAAEIYC
ncbi:MAG: coenzyme Q-binding protein COQ10 [Reinekea sp.]|jgi:coenzyme Q-binding protein COQ10